MPAHTVVFSTDCNATGSGDDTLNIAQALALENAYMINYRPTPIEFEIIARMAALNVDVVKVGVCARVCESGACL